MTAIHHAAVFASIACACAGAGPRVAAAQAAPAPKPTPASPATPADPAAPAAPAAPVATAATAAPPTYSITPVEGFSWDLYAQEPLVEDPVAFTIDPRGNLYIAESFRQERGVEDNRSSSFWLNDDLQLQSVADRVKMYEKWAAKREGGMAYYRREEDRVTKLADSDGDGVPDTKTNFSGSMNAPEDGTGAGVMYLNGDVYYTCIPNLWKFRDTSDTGVASGARGAGTAPSSSTGVADIRERMFTGFGIRTALRGHDMHGLVQGPDGRIYWSIGDRGYRVTTKEGVELARTFTGAVFRCEPDGSGLEVFAHSLRNPQELAFNQWGDLFTGDNNSDAGDRARIVYIMEGGETGWDMNYQTLEGQNQRGPWSQERTWWKWDADDAVRPAWTLPPIEHLTDGPSGIVFYPGLGLPEKYDNHFFLCDFLGGDEYSRIVSFAVEPSGAGYTVVDAHSFVTHVLPTDVDFGYDGRMYISDWSNGWESDRTGQIFRVWQPEALDDSRVHELGVLMREGFATQPDAMLMSMLAHPDIRLRQGAHIELAGRPAAVPGLVAVASDTGRTDRERLHALWALGIQARREGGAAATSGGADAIVALLADPSVEVRRLAARLAGDAAVVAAGPGLVELLGDDDGRVRAQAAIALGKIKHHDAFLNLSAVIWENDNQDPFLRHAAVLGLVGTGTPDKIHELAADQFPQNRLAAVLAMRLMNDPQLARLLHDPDLRVATEAARAINDLGIVEAEPALAAIAAKYTPTEQSMAAAGGSAAAAATSWTRELWANQKAFPLDQLENGAVFSTPPTKSATSEEAVGYSKAGNDYVQRLTGEFTAPVDGTYIFAVASDDDSVLTVTPAAATARVSNYVNPGSWDSQPSQRTAPVSLRAGQVVSLDARARQGGGGNHLAIGVVHPDGRLEAPIGSYTGDTATVPLLRRVIAANLRGGTTANATALADMARNPALPPIVRTDAVGALADFMQPSPRNRVNGHWQSIDGSTRDLAEYKQVLARKLPSLVANGSSDVRTLARDLAGKYGVVLDSAAAFATAVDATKPASERIACLQQLAQDKDARLQLAVDSALLATDSALRAQGRAVLARIDPERGVPLLVTALERGTVPEQQAAIRALAQVDTPAARAAMAAQADRLASGTLPRALQVDVIEVVEATPALLDRASTWRASLPADDANAAWLICLEGGDADAGRHIVNYHSAAACLRCHTVEGTGGHAAPPLAGTATRHDRMGLLLSLVSPNAQVAEGFGPVSAMPAMGTLLTPREMRDVVEYLTTLK